MFEIVIRGERTFSDVDKDAKAEFDKIVANAAIRVFDEFVQSTNDQVLESIQVATFTDDNSRTDLLQGYEGDDEEEEEGEEEDNEEEETKELHVTDGGTAKESSS